MVAASATSSLSSVLLAAIGLVEIQEHVAGGLHGDGARPLRLVAGDEIDQHRAHHAEVVDAVVLEEALVLGRDERVLDEIGNLIVGDRNAPLLTDLRDERAAARIDPQRHLQFDVAHHFERRKRRHEVHVAAREPVSAEECDEGHTAEEDDQQPKPIPFHGNHLPLLALPAGGLHSNR